MLWSALVVAAGSAVRADSVEILALVPPAPATVDGIPRPAAGTPRPPATPANSVTVEVAYTVTTATADRIQAYPGMPGDFLVVSSSSSLPECSVSGPGSGRCAVAFALYCDADSPPTTTVSEVHVALYEPAGATLAEDSRRPAEYTFRCPPAAGAPDLVVAASGPAVITAGAELGPGTALEASNVGSAPAPGTVGSLDPSHGFMIDHVLSTDTTVPPGFATYSPTWREDVLLRGGRASNTTDLAAGASEVYPDDNAAIPSDTPPGEYYLCAQIDPADEVAESDETNNVDCGRVTVGAAAASGGGLGRWIVGAGLALVLLYLLVRRRS